MKNKKSLKKEKLKIVVSKNGPYLVFGNLPLAKEIALPDREGNPKKWVKGKRCSSKGKYARCRCGCSKNPPYCDGTHNEINFDGTETAARKKYFDKAKKITGPKLDLFDYPELCSTARFCHRVGGTWNLVKNSDNQKSKKTAIQQSGDCPSGRLVAWDKKTGRVIEPKFRKSISLVEDPGERVSGPLWVKGGVSVESSDGTKYEIRNRVTLCRCGRSKNKPFCDGSHIAVAFNDGDKTINK